MHLLHLTPAYVDEQMTAWDFLRAVTWIDSQSGE